MLCEVSLREVRALFHLVSVEQEAFQRGVTSVVGGLFDEKSGLDHCFTFLLSCLFAPYILMCDPVLPLARGWRVSGVCLHL